MAGTQSNLFESGLSERPVELDPNYIAPEEPIEVTARRPRVGEWVNTHYPVPNGSDFEFRRSVDGPYLGRVERVTDEGCLVQIWSRPHMKFVDRIFAPHGVMISRTVVNHYSLTGNWPAQWQVAA